MTVQAALTALGAMQGNEIGNDTDVTRLLMACGVGVERMNESLHVKGDKFMTVVRLQSRRQILRWCKTNGVEAEMPEEGEWFAQVGRVAAAVLCADTGRDAVTPEEAVHAVAAHTKRMEYLKLVVAGRTET